MAKRKTDLSRAVLINLGVADAAGPIAHEDAELVENRYDQKLSEWRDRGLVYWTNTDRNTAEIPDQIFLALCDLVSLEVTEAFGKALPIGSKEGLEERHLARIRRHMQKYRSGEPTRFEVF